MRKVRARAESMPSGGRLMCCQSRKGRRWYKRYTSKLRRRMEKAGMEPENMRALIRGWYD